MKRFLLSFACLLLAIGSWGANFMVDGINYILYTSGPGVEEAHVAKGSSSNSGDIVIPSTVTYEEKTYSVTAIGENAFYGCSDLASVTFEGYASIKTGAFSGCTGLKKITIKDRINIDSEYSFNGCTNLESIIFTNSAKSIDCIFIINTIKNITVEEGNSRYKSIDGVLFNKSGTEIIRFPPKKDMFSYTVPNSVTTIGYSAFYRCSGLTSILLPNTLTTIDNNAFYGCRGLTSITIPNSVTTISYRVFYGCSGLTSIILPNSLITIDDSAFYGCSGLTSIILPNSLTTIGYKAFEKCTGLTEITIPNSVTKIGFAPFYECNNLTSIKCPDAFFNIVYQYCTGIREITVPSTVTEIGGYAFIYCSRLKELYIPNTVKKMNNVSFKGCTSLQKVYLPDCAILEEGAFANLRNLQEVSIGSFTGNIGKYFGQKRSAGGAGFENGFYICKQGKTDYKHYYLLPTNLKLIIRNQKEFGDYTLQDTPVFNIELEVPVESFGTNAFQDAGLAKVTLADNIKTLPSKKDLGKLPNLTEFSAKGLESIESGIFYGSPKLQKLELPFPGPGTVSSVGNFGDLFGTNSGDGLRAVTQFFENGTNKTYYIPSSLTELVLAEGCEMIPYGGLYNCNMLEKITLPTSLYMVGEKAFYGCAKISDIYCKGADPAVAYDSSFEGMRVSSCKLHIPYNTAELYKRSTGWKNFYYFEEEAPLNISVTKTIENAGVIYGLNEYQPGQTAELKAVANSGYTFKGWMENGLLITDASVYSFVVSDSRTLTAWFVPVLDDNTVEISSAPDGAVFGYTPVEGAASYRLDVYTDEDLSVSAGSTVETAQGAKAKTRTAASTRTISISGLNADSRYYYKITALTESGIILSQFTGSFMTKSATGIDDVTAMEKVTVTARYDSAGRRINVPVKGLNIIRYSDGSMRKVIIR